MSKFGEMEKIHIENLCDAEDILQEDELMQLCSGNFKSTQSYLRSQNSTVDDLEARGYPSCCSNETDEDERGLTISEEVNHNKKRGNNEPSEPEITDEHRYYESEEHQKNVISIKVKKDGVNEYIDDEAELSESDWDSADEDERALDRYDIELGDEDEYDQEKLQNELARIHMTKLMDRDASEIKKIEELLFVDEENHGLARQKQFKWKTINDNFTLDSEQFKDDEELKEEEDERQWRKMKYDREKVLSEINQHKRLFLPDINLGRKVKVMSVNKVKMLPKTDQVEFSPFSIPKSLTNHSRGSFLNRDHNNLSIFSNTSRILENKKRKLAPLECNESKKSKFMN